MVNFKNKVWAIVLCTLIFFFLPAIAPHNPDETTKTVSYLGHDVLGRDLLSRWLFAGKSSFFVSVFGSLISIAISFILLFTLAISQKRSEKCKVWVETTTNVATNLLLSLPMLMVVLLVIRYGIQGNQGLGVWGLGAILGFLYSPMAWRHCRTKQTQLERSWFIPHAKQLGADPIHLFFKHHLPHLLPWMLSVFAIQASQMLLTEAALSFMGFGLSAPENSWGLMLFEGWTHLDKPIFFFLPALSLLLLSTLFTLMTDMSTVDAASGKTSP